MTAAQCGPNLLTRSSDGASGCSSVESSLQYCCTQWTCTYQGISGRCSDSRYTSCAAGEPSARRTTIAGASGCKSIPQSTATCCLDREPPRLTPAPIQPTPVRTPSPTPQRVQPDGKCQYGQLNGECSLEGSCNGVHIPNGAGSFGCEHLTTPGVGCCIRQSCTVQPTDGSPSFSGVCRGVGLCLDAGLATFTAAFGASGCTTAFPVGNECCAPPQNGEPPTPTNIKEFACRVGDRPGLCKTPAACAAPSVWHSKSAAGFEGCVNSAIFDSDGCCTAADTIVIDEPAGECTLENPIETCTTGRICKSVNGELTCELNPDWDCQEAGGCVVEGQECAANRQGEYRCGAVRTCLALGCPTGKECTPLGLGYHECVGLDDPNDCRVTPCEGDLVCREDPRGPDFPPICAPNDVVEAPTLPTPPPTPPPMKSVKEPESDDGWPLWLIIVIAVVGLILCIVCCVVIAALLVCLMRSDDEQDPFATNSNYDPYGQQMNTFGTSWDTETQELKRGNPMYAGGGNTPAGSAKIGRASCRERV